MIMSGNSALAVVAHVAQDADKLLSEVSARGPAVIVIGGALVLALAAAIAVRLFRAFLFICRPNEMLIVSGKRTVLPGGETLNFAVLQAGRHWQVPFVQTVKTMDVRLIPIELAVMKMFSHGGIPLDVHAIANVKITSDPLYVHNAVERFLGKPIEDIRTTARQTLEGKLRDVLAQLTPEQVNEDRIEFANQLLESTTPDFNRLGLHLDTLKVLRVEDEAKYLVNIGRTQIANAIRDAENAENQANQEVAQEEATARQLAEVAQKQAEIGVAQKRNQLRALVGQLEGAAQSVEREAAVAAEQARAEAEQELQGVRKDLETKRLYAEVVLPAEAKRKAAELIAEGEAAPRREQGAANATVMQAMSEALTAAGPQAREMFVLSQLDTLVAQVAAKVKTIQVGAVQVIDAGDGKAVPALASSYPATVATVMRTLKELTGVDVADMLADHPHSNGGAR
jgi:flotillin